MSSARRRMRRNDRSTDRRICIANMHWVRRAIAHGVDRCWPVPARRARKMTERVGIEIELRILDAAAGDVEPARQYRLAVWPGAGLSHIFARFPGGAATPFPAVGASTGVSSRPRLLAGCRLFGERKPANVEDRSGTGLRAGMIGVNRLSIPAGTQVDPATAFQDPALRITTPPRGRAFLLPA